MNWFKNLRTANKLFFAFGLMAIAMMVVGWLGISATGDVSGRMGTLFERDMVGLSLEKDLHITFVRMRANVRGVALERDKSAQVELVRATEKLDGEVRAAFDEVEKKLVRAEAKAKLADVRAVYTEWYALCQDSMRLSVAGDQEGAYAKIKLLIPIGKKADTLMGELEADKHMLAQRSYDEANAVYHRNRTVQIASMVVALLFAMLCALMLGRAIGRPLATSVEVLEAVAQGDFTKRLDVDTTDEVGVMAQALNKAVGGVRTALTDVRTVAAEVAAASQQLSSAAQDISSGAQQQASSLEETAASLEEITSTVKRNAENAQQASQLATGARSVAEKGGKVVESAVGAMDEITSSSKRIADIITAIDEIAFQTNLLALNAAVEAARAGEQGRGFAVVAAEVRNLAQRSASAAKEIKGLIGDSVEKVEVGSKHVTESGETLGEIVSSVKRVTDMVSEIAAASDEQHRGIEQVNSAIAQMDQVTQSNASQTEELSATSEALSTQATRLQQLVSRFRLDGAGARVAMPVVRQVPRPAPKKAAPVSAPRKLAEVRVLPSLPPPTGGTGTDGFQEF